jgi:hypothetical protein
MHRRLIAAIDLGLRDGEMLKVQVKHVDFGASRAPYPRSSHRPPANVLSSRRIASAVGGGPGTDPAFG